MKEGGVQSSLFMAASSSPSSPGSPGSPACVSPCKHEKFEPEVLLPPRRQENGTHVAVAPLKITKTVVFFTWFNPYRQLLFISVTINCILILIALHTPESYMKNHLAVMVLGNVLVGTMVRSEWVIRFLYWSSIMLFRWDWIPKIIKISVVGVLYHIGGLHSGCGVSAFLWLALSWTCHLMDKSLYHGIILGTLLLSMLSVLVACAGAIPPIRNMHHNFFEATHRFFGWFGILSTMVFVVSSAFWSTRDQRWNSLGATLLVTEEFWFVIAIMMLTIAAWITVAKVPVEFVHTSEKASIICMPGGLTSGLHTRISFGGLREWHIFGSISEGKHSSCHYLVVAVQGDFTRALNKSQPSHLYTKTWKPCGLPYFSRLFQRGVAICTGSGIGAVGSTCIQHENWFLVWIGPELEATYGSTFVNYIQTHIHENRRIIWDTRQHGRPDVPLELENIFRAWNADVALFIGSPALNKEVLQTCRARKIPVYGSIWDA